MTAWSKWAAFPHPERRGIVVAPIGPGVYELRRKDTAAFVLIGIGKNCASRMASLLPSPLGQGTRTKQQKAQVRFEEYCTNPISHAARSDSRCCPRSREKTIA